MQTAANLFKHMCYRYREELMAGIIIAGWDKRRAGQVRNRHMVTVFSSACFGQARICVVGLSVCVSERDPF